MYQNLLSNSETNGGRLRRIGMLTPSSNTVLEPVCAAILADQRDVSIHFARFRVTEISLTDEANEQFSSAGMLTAAAMLADARVDAICWNGTSASWLGLDQDRALCASIKANIGIAATSSVLAMVEALRAAGLKRVALVTPYIDRVQSQIAENLTSEGFDIVAERHSGLSENFAFANVEQTALIEMIRDVASYRPEAILVLCTNLRVAPLVAGLEAEIGIPILDSVATAVLGAVLLIGLRADRIKGYGQVFAGLRSKSSEVMR
jgi:maleate isomerase